jgi:hypothetical protein
LLFPTAQKASFKNYFKECLKIRILSLASMAHTCNPNYSEGRDQEDHGLKPTCANSSGDPILKNPFRKKGWRSSSRYRSRVQP